MSMTTSINELPQALGGNGGIGSVGATVGGTGSGGVAFHITEKDGTPLGAPLGGSNHGSQSSSSPSPPPPNQALDPKTIQELVSSLQAASSSGMTQLPSRDIPSSMESHTHDVQIKPNYIPQAQPTRAVDKGDLRGQYYDAEMGDETRGSPVGKRGTVDDDDVATIVREDFSILGRRVQLATLYDEIHNPLFAGLLYFLFQMPIVRKTLIEILPDLFHGDGNVNIYGILLMSVAFALAYFLMFKTLNYF